MASQSSDHLQLFMFFPFRAKWGLLNVIENYNLLALDIT
jgi:hypothetical protein